MNKIFCPLLCLLLIGCATQKNFPAAQKQRLAVAKANTPPVPSASNINRSSTRITSVASVTVVSDSPMTIVDYHSEGIALVGGLQRANMVATFYCAENVNAATWTSIGVFSAYPEDQPVAVGVDDTKPHLFFKLINSVPTTGAFAPASSEVLHDTGKTIVYKGKTYHLFQIGTSKTYRLKI